MTQRLSVAVVGAGIGGLTAAYELQKLGIDVTVLEAGQVPGGRMGDVPAGSIPHMSTGAHGIIGQLDHMFALIDELGIRDEVIPLPERSMSIVTRDRTIKAEGFNARTFLAGDLVKPKEIFRLSRLIPDLVRVRRTANLNHIETGAGFDDESVTDYLTRKVGARFLEEVINPTFRTIWACNSEEMSKAYFLMVMAAGGVTSSYTFRSGIGALSRALADRVKPRYGCRVTRVAPHTEDGRYLVEFTEEGKTQSIQVDVVVSAVEGDRVASIFPVQADWERRFFADVPYSQYAMVEYVLNKPARQGISFELMSRDHPSVLAAIQSSPGLPGTPIAGMALAILAPDRMWQVLNSDGSNLEEVALRAVEEFYPGFSEDVAEAHPQFNGYRIAMFPVGQAKRVKSFLSLQDSGPKRVYYVGDYLSNATTAGSASIAMRTAKKIAHDWC